MAIIWIGRVGYFSEALYSTKEWMEPADVGECFEIPPSSITETEQRTEEKRWELQKEKRNTFENLLMVLKGVALLLL